MNVFNISDVQGPRGPQDKDGVDRSKGAPKGDRAARPASSTDSFAQSGRAAEVQSLVDALASGDGLRSELVDKFKALMELGELDTPEAAEKAASAMLGANPEI